MAKKQKKLKPKQVPTKRQLSKWQRQTKMRRIIIIAAAVFLAGIVGYVGHGYYNNEIKPLREVVIEVNDTSFNMGYYVKMLDAFAKGTQPSQLSYMADIIANQIIANELLKQGTESLGINANAQEINARMKESKTPDSKASRDMVAATILREKLLDYFGSQLPDTMEQANTQVMLVESEAVANEVMNKVENGEDFSTLVGEFSYDSKSKEKGGDLGWLPQELMPNSLTGDAVFSSESNELSKIYDKSASKSVGYWLIEVTDKDEEKGIKVRAILLGSKQKADEVKAELTDENFAELAKEHSQHESKDNDGELGWLKKGDMKSEAFDKVAFNLDLNVISEPVKDKSVQTTGGYWVVKVLERGEHELSDEVRKELAYNDFTEWFQVQKETSTINNYLDEGKKKFAIERVLKGK